jgi:hypothetical protein
MAQCAVMMFALQTPTGFSTFRRVPGLVTTNIGRKAQELGIGV